MKKLLTVLSLFVTSSSFARNIMIEAPVLKTTMYVEFSSISLSRDAMTFKDITIWDNNKKPHYIATGLGWGSTPLNTLCNVLSDSKYNYADSYGQVDTPSIFGPKRIMYFMPNKEDGSLAEIKVEKREAFSQAVIYKNLTCRLNESNY